MFNFLILVAITIIDDTLYMSNYSSGGCNILFCGYDSIFICFWFFNRYFLKIVGWCIIIAAFIQQKTIINIPHPL